MASHISCFSEANTFVGFHAGASTKKGESIKPEEEEMKEIFENEKMNPNLSVPDWLTELIPSVSTEIPHDPVDEDDENKEKTFLPIKNDKQMPILVWGWVKFFSTKVCLQMYDVE